MSFLSKYHRDHDLAGRVVVALCLLSSLWQVPVSAVSGGEECDECEHQRHPPVRVQHLHLVAKITVLNSDLELQNHVVKVWCKIILYNFVVKVCCKIILYNFGVKLWCKIIVYNFVVKVWCKIIL